MYQNSKIIHQILYIFGIKTKNVGRRENRETVTSWTENIPRYACGGKKLPPRQSVWG
jgi:hypothetical protein